MKRFAKIMSAYHLYGNFGEKFPSNGTGIFFGTENRNTIYKILVNLSLSLNMKPGTSNLDKWYRKFRFGKYRKKEVPPKVLLFCGKFPPL